MDHVIDTFTKSKSLTVKAKKTVPDTIVLVQPKTKQKCSTTRAELDKKNIPSVIAISSVNNLPKGGIEIKCKSQSERSKLHEKATKELSEDYTIIIPRLRNPKIRVTNMSEKHSGEDIIARIKNQNEWVKQADMKVLQVFEVKYNETYGAIIEIDPKSFNVIVKEKTIMIGMDVCNVTESLSVLRCYRCCGYLHKANICKNKKACLRCGGVHEMKECKAERNECINCKVVAQKINSNIDCNHPAWSKTCPVLQRNIEREKQRTNYEE